MMPIIMINVATAIPAHAPVLSPLLEPVPSEAGVVAVWDWVTTGSGVASFVQVALVRRD